MLLMLQSSVCVGSNTAYGRDVISDPFAERGSKAIQITQRGLLAGGPTASGFFAVALTPMHPVRVALSF